MQDGARSPPHSGKGSPSIPADINGVKRGAGSQLCLSLWWPRIRSRAQSSEIRTARDQDDHSNLSLISTTACCLTAVDFYGGEMSSPGPLGVMRTQQEE